MKFVFATTEIRKVPVTVLSRCQRFDLRRVEPETLAAHLGRHRRAARRSRSSPEALGLIARAADGSVRDGLSLLDQAIAHAEGPVEAEAGRRPCWAWPTAASVLDLFEAVMRGDAAPARWSDSPSCYARGADPVAVLQDLLELSHSCPG